MKNPNDSPAASRDGARPKLSLFDATCIMVGIIIGASIYKSSPDIAEGASHGSLALVEWLRGGQAAPLSEATNTTIAIAGLFGVWLVGGLVALVGSLCYAELSTAFPHEGGNYYFLKRAFGDSTAFAFAWTEFWIVRPGNVGALAFVFARYASELAAPLLPGLQAPSGQLMLACAAIVLLTAVNLLGIRTGSRTQNVLTACKVAGLAIIVATGLAAAGSQAYEVPASSRPFQPGLGLALIFVMFAYGGWSDMSYVAADVRDPERNISRSLLLGTAMVTAIYLLVTLAFVAALSLPGLRNSPAVAADTVSLRFGAWGASGISILICVSTLGAINGMLFAGGRVFYALGKEDAAFTWLGAWNDRFGGPVRSLVVQSLATLALAIAFGRSENGFERLVVFTGPFYCGFLLLIAIGFFVLRRRGEIGAGYRAPLYPLPPLALAAACAFMTYSSTDFAVRNGTSEGYWAVAVVASGVLALVLKRWFAGR